MSGSGIIDELFGGPGRTAVLRVLASADSALTGRQIAERAVLSPAGAARALDRLAELGVTTRQSVGRAVLHELDRSAPVVTEVLLPTIEAERRIDLARATASAGSVPAEVIECLVSEFDPLRILLFGSRAKGEADELSDFDLLVVVPEVADKHAMAVEMLVALGHLAVPIDVIPTDPAEIERRGDVAGSVLNEALRQGEVVYERVD